MKRIIAMLLCLFTLLMSGCIKYIEVITIIEAVDNNNYDLVSNKLDIINRFKDVHIDGDGIEDDITLYFKDGVRLKVNDVEILVLDIDERELVFDRIPSSQLIFNMYLSGNKILVGYTYHFTQKYGSTAELICYEYNSNEIRELWSSFNEIDRKPVVENYNEETNCIEVIVNKQKKKIILDDEEEEKYLRFTKKLKPEMEFRIITNYEFSDINKDGNDELVTKTVVTFGSCELTKAYYSIYKFSGKGMHYLDSWFGSASEQSKINKIFN